MPDTTNPLDQPEMTPAIKPVYTLRAWLVASCVVMLIAFAALFWFFGQLENSAQQRKHTYLVLNNAEKFLSSMKDAETGQRGYLLTGDEAFLEPYLLVRSNVKNQLLELRQLTTNSPAQKHLDALMPLVDAKLVQLDNSITLRRSDNINAVIKDVRSAHGKQLMDAIRTETSAFMQIEKNAQQQNIALFETNIRRLLSVFISVCIFMALLAMAFAYLVFRHSKMKMANLVLLDTQHLLDIEEDANRQLKLINTALQISQEKLAVTLYSIGDGVIVTDSKACVTLLNSVAEKLTGWTHAEAEGRKVDEIFHIINKTTRQVSTIPIMATLAHGTIQGLANHTVLIDRSGNELDIADSCAPIHNRENEVIGAVLVFRDVTVEYAIQQALHDSTTQIEAILNTVADGIITFHSNDGLITSANPAIAKMFGYNSTELLGQNFSLLVPEFDETRFDYSSGSQNKGDKGIGHEMPGQHKSGTIFPLELALSEMWLGGQRFFTGILRDISARKRIEAELFQADALQRAIFNSENFSSIATDANGVIQIFNVGAEKMLGYSAAEVMNRITPADLSDPQELIKRAQTLSTELSTLIQPGFEALVFKATRGIADIYELTYICKDGSRLPALVSVTALRDNQNAIIGYLLIGTDNTAHKKADEALRAANAKVNAWGEALNSFAIVAETDLQGKIIYANDPFCQISQYSREELLGKNHSEVVNSGHHPKAFWQEMWSTIGNGKIWQGEIKNHAKDGTNYWVDTVIVPQLGANGKPVTYLSFRFLITDRKLLDQMLRDTNIQLSRAKSTAEKANLAKSDFLSSMSHELRTPLSAILGFAQLMQSGSPLPTATQKRNIEQILQAGWYLLELINEILDLALIESGKLSLSLEPISLAEVLLECQAIIEPLAQKNDIKVSFPESNTDYYVKADRTRVKQVLINLLSNAVKYNCVKGTVVVSCHEQSPERLRISIEDTGAGLSAEKIAHLFQPFNRLGQECNTIEGTGIGLVMSKRLIELMGGEIGLNSTVGTGSTFWIDINTTPERQTLAHLTKPETETETETVNAVEYPVISTLRTLLYIEDNPANLMLVEDIITRRPDIRLLTARDGNSGIAMARITLPDIILMDINLPGINGIQAMKILAADLTTQHIPVIALSANAMAADIEKGLASGFFRYLTKPIKITEFMSTLNTTLDFINTESVSKNREEINE